MTYEVKREEAVKNCLEGLRSLDIFIESAILGIRHASEATSWVEVNRRLKKFQENTSEDPLGLENALDRAQVIEKYAKQQLIEGQPYIYSIAVIRVWTMLETLADDLVFDRLCDGKYQTDSEAIGGIKLPLREILRCTPEQQAEAILNELKQSSKSRLQQGVGKFEVVLGALSLSGQVDEEIRRAIFECCQIRNLIVHRNALVDSKFASACPWLTSEIGSALAITRTHFSLYYYAAFWYAIELQIRTWSLDGQKPDLELIDIQNLFLRNVRDICKAREKQQTSANS